MSTATSSVTTSDPSWATPSTQAGAPQWQSQEQYQQYYNYYQAMSQAAVATTTQAVTTTASDPSSSYSQDYSKAWDEYYKAYYGQSYSVSAPATQYPATGYNYDQYGYPNLAAPPPTYQYNSVATTSAYQYPQPPSAAPVATVATTYSYTDGSYTTPTSVAWNEPPPSYEKPAAYNQAYQQPSNYEKPQYDQNNMFPKSDNSIRSNETANKTDNYMDRFPPPTFDSTNKPGVRQNYRGRGRGDQRPMDNRNDSFSQQPRGNRFGSSNNKSGRGNFNDRPQIDNDDRSQYNNNRQQTNNFDRAQYNNDFQDDDTSFSGRGGRPPFRGRGGDSSFRGRGGDSSFRGRGGDSSFRGRGEDSSFRGRGGDSSFRGRGADTSFRGRGAFEGSNSRTLGYDDQNRNSNETPDYAWKSELDEPDMTKESPWETEPESVLPGWTMGGPAQKRKLSNTDVADSYAKIQNKAPAVHLMDIAVRPSGQSPIIVRRQALIDQWQSAVREISERKQPIQQYWNTLKSGLIPEVQGLLCPSFVRGDQAIHCEIHLDDIFLVQAKGYNEDLAIEEASKSMWQMLQTKLFVHTASRSWGTEKVPVFCVSRCVTGPVSCPPFIKGVAPLENQQFPSSMTTSATTIKSVVQPSGHLGVPLVAKVVSTTPITPAKIESVPVKAPVTAVMVSKTPSIKPPIQHDYKEDDIFLVIDPSLNEKDQAISILNNTAKFNHISIEYKHEKPPNAPHISQCLITINGQEFEKSEARDYLCAKREAADKAVVIFKESCPQITLNFDQALEVARDSIMKPGKSCEDSIGEFLKAFASNIEEDVIYKFGQQFTNEDRDAILKTTNKLNLSSKSEGKGILMIFKQFPVEEMKRRILRNGYCAQYRLVQCTLNKK